jgi:type IV pilus assembly protein PilQ
LTLLRLKKILSGIVFIFAIPFFIPVLGFSAQEKTTDWIDPARSENYSDERIVIAQRDDSKDPLPKVTGVSVSENTSGVVVQIRSTIPIQYTIFKLASPDRLIMDIPRVDKAKLETVIEVNKGAISQIRPLYFDESRVLRLEMTLQNSNIDYSVTRMNESGALQVQVSANEVKEDVKPVEVVESVQKDETPSKEIKIVESKPQKVEEKKSQPKPREFSKDLKSLANSSQGLLESAADKIAKNENNPASKGDSCEPLLVGEKKRISFDFQRAELRNILRIISETGKFNIVVSPEVSGTVTTRLVDIPWNTALNIILKNNGLGRECFDDIMRIATQAQLGQEAQARFQVKQNEVFAIEAKKRAADLFTEVIRISYADISTLTDNLEGLRTDRGRITTDTRTNTLVLTDIRTSLNEMINLVKTLDIMPPQVMIEARIVELNKNATKDLGIQWGGTISRITDKEFPNEITVGPSSLTTSGFIVDLPTTSAPAGGIGLTLGSLAGDTRLDIQLAALESKGRGKVISNPKVTTLDNREAKIESGRSIPYQTVSQDGTAVEFVDASLSLTVTPHITADGNIYMKILAQKNAADFGNSVNGVPSITKKEASTEVLVKNGDTTVLGGLYESTINENRNQVPVLGSIPILGNLFQKRLDTDLIEELLIFITPVVVQDFSEGSQ